MLKTFLVTALGVVLTACQTTGPLDETSYQSRIPRGSTLVLTQDIELAPGRAGVQFQNGKVLRDRPDPSRPSCELRTDVLATVDEPVVIKAVTFTTGWVGRYINLAELPVAGVVSVYDRVTFVTKIPVSSPRQPLVKHLLCEITGEKIWITHVSIADIRAALGNIFELQISAS